MKRFIIIGILALSTLSASAQSVKGLIEQYRHEKNVIHLHITPALMSFLKVLAKSHSDDSKALKAVSSFRILVFDDCDSIVKSRFRNTVQTFHPKGIHPPHALRHLLRDIRQSSTISRQMRLIMFTSKKRKGAFVNCSFLLLTNKMAPLCGLRVR